MDKTEYEPTFPKVEELATMPPQEVFDRAAVHLIRQGKKAMAYGACSYRGDGGLCCAVGVLIPEELYSKKLEESAAVDLIHHIAADPKLSIFVQSHEDLLTQLQHVHDSRNPDMWATELHGVAQRLSLETTALDAACASA